MLFAFMVMAHTDYEQLIRLCEKLKEYGDVFIHVDKNTSDDYYANLKSFANTHNTSGCYKTIVVEKRVGVKWGAFSQVNAMRILLDNIFDKKSPKYDRIIYISGLDYPLYSRKELENLCIANTGSELMTVYNISRGADAAQRQKVTLYHYFRDINLTHRFLRKAIVGGTMLFLKYLGIRKKPFIIINGKRWDIYFSSQWFLLTHDCCEYVWENLRNNETLNAYFKTAKHPEESIVPTIVLNSKYGEHVREINSPDFNELSVLHYLQYTDKIWTYDEKDFDSLMKSKKPFVRKLVSGKSEKLIEMINKCHDGQ